jgi:cytochrome c biogenesis protein CcmG/thiol:disulfide interchange protein DsbE
MFKQAFLRAKILLMALVTITSACVSATSTPISPTPTSATTLSTPSHAPTPATVEASVSSTNVPVKPRKGFRAPDFTLLNPKGEKVSLGDFRGQPVMINFWATWCSPCRDELPEIQAAYENSKDLMVMGISFQEKASDVEPFVEKKGLTFPILLDSDGQIAMKYQARGLPTSFFVNPEGIITAVHIGPVTAGDLENYVAQARGK